MLSRLLATTKVGGCNRIFPAPSRALSSISTVSLGTAYEHHVLARLPHLLPGELSLTRVGGAGDGGVDLRGWWQLPQNHDAQASRLRVVVQCKASAGTKKHGPVILREVEGVLARNRLPAQDDEDDTASQPLLAVICSSTGFSKQTNIQVNSLRGSANHIMLVHLPLADTTLPIEDESGRKELEVALSQQNGAATSFKSSPDGQDEGASSAADWPLSILTSPSLTSSSGPLQGKMQELQGELVGQHAKDSIVEVPGAGPLDAHQFVFVVHADPPFELMLLTTELRYGGSLRRAFAPSPFSAHMPSVTAISTDLETPIAH